LIKVALLSRWHVHADDYAQDIQSHDHMSIELVWDEDPERGGAWAKELHVPFEKNLETVLTHPEIDAVVVNTPTNMHKEIIMAAARHNKHIFTEKVLAFTVEDCEDIYQAVQDAGVQLMVSLPRLTDNNFRHAEKAIQENWIGQLTTIRCRLAHNGAVVNEGQTTGWLPERFFNREQAGGGAMIDLGAHPIYLTNRLAGKAKAVYARLQQVSVGDVDDNSAIMVDYESGALAIIESSFVSHGSPFQLELYGTAGTLLINDNHIRVCSTKINEGQPTDLEEDLTGYPMPMDQWADAIRKETGPNIKKEDVIHLTLINEAAFKSHQEERRVKIEEIMDERS